MDANNLGLVAVPTHLLKRALKALHSGDMVTPININSLCALGLQDVGESLLGAMRGLDKSGVHAVLVAVLAERLAEQSAA